MKRKEPQPCAYLSPDGTVCNLVTAHLRPGEIAPCAHPEFSIRGGKPNEISPRTGTKSCPIILLDRELQVDFPKGPTVFGKLHRREMIEGLHWDDGIIRAGSRIKLDS